MRKILMLIFCIEFVFMGLCLAQTPQKLKSYEDPKAVPTPAQAESTVAAEVSEAVSETVSGEFITLEDEEKKTEEHMDVEEEERQLKPGYVTVNFKGADIRTVLNYLSDVSGVDIIPAPDVSGPITLKLTDKPWETALDIIVRNYGYAYERDRDIIRVVTIESLKMEELATEVVKLNYAKAVDVEEIIKDMLSDRGKVGADDRINALVLTDIPTYLYKAKQVIFKLDKKTPQIMIEAKIIETMLGKDERMGIDWNIRITASGAAKPTTIPFNALLPDWGLQSSVLTNVFTPLGQTQGVTANVLQGGTTAQTETAAFPSGGTLADSASRLWPFVDADLFTFGTLDFTQFSAVIEYLKRRSDTEIISNPRVTTLNNKQAKIMVGKVYNFPTFDQVEETGRWVISGYEAKELGIRLLVTPNVNENGEIVVDLKPEISNYLGLEQISEELSAPLWATREAETQVMVKDGETIFIGGLIKENTVKVDKRFPILGDLVGDLPFIGNVFKYKVDKKEKTELIFFISVHIVKDMAQLAKFVKNPTEVYLPLGEGEIEIDPFTKKKRIIKTHEPIFDLRKGGNFFNFLTHTEPGKEGGN
ncbi:MAG: hypothetical protein HQ579_08650 [Candidatus Omnitrophica bacterium]|nr:hypothetical protein [Candidatus Omnitrophota bacterium]